jgi:hypothetical protein
VVATTLFFLAHGSHSPEFSSPSFSLFTFSRKWQPSLLLPMAPALSLVQGLIFVTLPTLLSVVSFCTVRPAGVLLSPLVSQAAVTIYLFVSYASQPGGQFSSTDLKWALQALAGLSALVLRVVALLCSQGTSRPGLKNTSDDEEHHWRERAKHGSIWSDDQTTSCDRSQTTVDTLLDVELGAPGLDASETVPKMSIFAWAFSLWRS